MFNFISWIVDHRRTVAPVLFTISRSVFEPPMLKPVVTVPEVTPVSV